MTPHDESTQVPEKLTEDSEREVGTPCATDPPAGDDVLPWRWSLPAKLAFILAGIILPVICFSVSAHLQDGPEWQSGQLSDYAQLLLSIKPSLAFYPLLFYCMFSMVLMVGRTEWGIQFFWVRFGIYTGVVLAIQYFLILAISLEVGFLTFIFIAPFASVIIWAIAWVLIKFFRAISSCMPKSIVTIFLFIALVGVGMVYPLVFMLAIIAIFICATPWAIIAYGAMTWYILKRPRAARWQFSLAQLLTLVSLVAVYCSAWRWSIKLMLTEYATLPTSAPPSDCYVTTAAARGHRWLVRAEPVGDCPENTLWANDQMRYLKAAELALAVTCRPAHRVCRTCYDRLGPPAAAILKQPVLADAAYLALKPAEWTARVVLAIILPGEDKLIKRLYRD